MIVQILAPTHMNTDTQPALNIYDDDLRISAFTYEVSRL